MSYTITYMFTLRQQLAIVAMANASFFMIFLVHISDIYAVDSWYHAQRRQNARLFSELGLPHPFIHRRVCGGSQFGRGDRHCVYVLCGTMPSLWLVYCAGERGYVQLYTVQWFH